MSTMQLVIETCLGPFRRTAWTGGDTPTPEFLQSAVGKQLVTFFVEDQIADCGGWEGVKNWLFEGQSVEDKINLFANRARYDAWATFRAGTLDKR